MNVGDLDLDRLLAAPLRSHVCEYGVVVKCGQPATTKRQRPAGGETWDVCDHHAEILDRLRENVARHRSLLDRLAGPQG